MTEQKRKTTSVIIVSYNTGPALWVCIYRVLQLKGLHEVIVVNNGNETGVELHLGKLEKKHERFHLITGQGNVGFAVGCNLGAQKATGDYVLLLNPDAVLMEQDAFQRFINVLEDTSSQPPAALVGGVLRNEDASEQRATRRNILTPQNALLEGVGLHRINAIKIPRLNITDVPLPEQPEQIPAISGACMMMDRERYVQMRGLDENYFLHVEDMDFCKRVHDAGGSVWLNPQVNILHYLSTSEVSSLFVERMKTKGFYRYFRLHYYNDYFWRAVIDFAITLRLGGKIAASFFEKPDASLRINDAMGLRRVQAIVRGVDSAMQTIRNKEETPIPAGSTVFITGASSAIGLFSIGRLLAYGCKVVALKHRTMIGFFHPNLTWVDGDLKEPESIIGKLGNIKCDYAIHCAAIWNIAGLSYVLQVLGAKHIVAFSSTSLLTKEHSSSPEEQEVSRKLAEGEAALKTEAQTWQLGYTILRPTMVYGAGIDQNITRIAEIIDRKHSFTLPKEATGLRAPVHADDLALAAIKALTNPAANGKTYTMQGGTSIQYHKMVAKICKQLNLPPKIFFVPKLHILCAILHKFSKKVPHPAVALRMQDDLVFADDGAIAELGIQPRAFLADGAIDLGICDESVCRSLLPA